MKARLIGPLLMVALGAAMVGGALLPDPMDVGTITPSTTTTTTDPCGPMIGAVNPCLTTTTMATTTTVDPCTVQAALVVQPCETTTTVFVPPETTLVPDPGPSTTVPGGVLPGGEEVDPTTPATPPAVSGGELARTGSNDGPLVVTGIALVLGGAGLAIAGRRHRLAER